MDIVDSTGRALDDSIVRDVLNYKNQLVDEYKFSRLPRKRGVAYVDDINHILFHYWAYEKAVYAEEQRRAQVATGILMASYFGCRPVLMFDTSLAFEDDTALKERERRGANRFFPAKDRTRCDTGEDRENGKLVGDDEESDSDSDADATCPDDFRGRRVLLWRRIIFFVARNDRPGKQNIIFITSSPEALCNSWKPRGGYGRCPWARGRRRAEPSSYASSVPPTQPSGQASRPRPDPGQCVP